MLNNLYEIALPIKARSEIYHSRNAQVQANSGNLRMRSSACSIKSLSKVATSPNLDLVWRVVGEKNMILLPILSSYIPQQLLLSQVTTALSKIQTNKDRLPKLHAKGIYELQSNCGERSIQYRIKYNDDIPNVDRKGLQQLQDGVHHINYDNVNVLPQGGTAKIKSRVIGNYEKSE